jgi:hypothetical protein
MIASSLICAAAVTAQDAADAFADAKDDGKLHITSGFVCPHLYGRFERDAAGMSDLETGAVYCAYSGLDGIYGTIVLRPLTGPYDAKTALVPEFQEQEGTGGKRIAESAVQVGTPTAPLSVYTRTYETSELESLHYRVLFAGAAVKNWAVETTIEYADPRDTAFEKAFLDAVYTDALSEIGAQPAKTP